MFLCLWHDQALHICTRTIPDETLVKTLSLPYPQRTASFSRNTAAKGTASPEVGLKFLQSMAPIVQIFHRRPDPSSSLCFHYNYLWWQIREIIELLIIGLRHQSYMSDCGPIRQPYSDSVPSPTDCSKIPAQKFPAGRAGTTTLFALFDVPARQSPYL
jgi:hypothetical protein